jgi:hypothetical protein
MYSRDMTRNPAPPAATGAGAHPEAVENALLAALRDGMPVGSVARLEALLQEHVAAIPRARFEVEKGLSRSGTSDVASFRGSFFDFLMGRFLPALERAILAAAPLPSMAADAAPAGDPPLNLVEAAELLVAVTRLLERRGVSTEFALNIADSVMQAVGAFGQALSASLAEPDPPDMRRLARELGKLELLRWLLEILEAHEHRRTISTQLQVSARQALRRATATIASFLTDAHILARRDTAAVTAEIEDLVTLVLLLVDTEQESAEAEAGNPFFRALSREEIAAFAAQATALAERMFDELDAFAAGTSQDDTLARPLRQVMQLSSFAGRLAAHVALDEIAELRRVIARRLAALEARMGGRPRIQRD